MKKTWLLAALLLTGNVGFSEENPSTADKNSWLQWRGPSRTGIVAETTWPDRLSEENLKKVWRVELGPSYSGPIVTPDHVFVTETKDKKYEVVTALERSSGKVAWTAQWEGSMKVPFFAAENGSWIRSTPCFDDGILYVAGMKDVLVALNAKDGSQAWKVDFVADTGSAVPDFGFVSSPLVIGDHLFVQAGGGFVKLEKKTGKIVWTVLKDGGGMMGSAFSSPIEATLCGKEQIVVQSRTKLHGIDIENGTELWNQEVPAFRGMNIVTPTIHNDQIFTSAYGGKSLLYSVTNTDGKFEVKEVWNNNKQGYMSSPTLIGDKIYMHLRNQRYTCMDWATGEVKWTSDTFGKYASLVATGDKILSLDQKGELHLLRAKPDAFELIGKAKVAESESWAHVGIAGSQVFIRDLEGLTVYDWSN